ncbi:hypothetical protein KUCAC02_000957 [Chaenocephalus aceratus]|uniref:Uncharacterized protein n=1 Tax=Chaenocephalus aceratus TaxID=36190 RepID=A0ACB9XX11_CHAAC|nr:hypothetical protein KUCAC02_000957 [Chaenocephalus aceratus]
MLLFVERTDGLSLHLNATSNFRVCWTAQAGQVRNAIRVRGHLLHGHRGILDAVPERSKTVPVPAAPLVHSHGPRRPRSPLPSRHSPASPSPAPEQQTQGITPGWCMYSITLLSL